MSHDPSEIILIYADLQLKKLLWLLSVLETVVLPNIFVETVTEIKYYLMNRKFKRTACIWNRILLLHLNVLTVTFDQFTSPLLNINIFFFYKKAVDPKRLDCSLYR